MAHVDDGKRAVRRARGGDVGVGVADVRNGGAARLDRRDVGATPTDNQLAGGVGRQQLPVGQGLEVGRNRWSLVDVERVGLDFGVCPGIPWVNVVVTDLEAL